MLKCSKYENNKITIDSISSDRHGVRPPCVDKLKNAGVPTHSRASSALDPAELNDINRSTNPSIKRIKGE